MGTVLAMQVVKSADVSGIKRVKDENGDLLADSYNILNKCKNYTQLQNMHNV
jgi:hypothetical protein